MKSARFQDVFGASLNRIESHREVASPASDAVDQPAPAPFAGPGVAQIEAESILLDVAPATMDEYMDRVLARTQRALRELERADAGDESPTPNSGADREQPAHDRTLPSAQEDASIRPAQNVTPKSGGASIPGDTRANRDNLKEIVIQSTRNTLVRQIRRRHWMVAVRKLLLVFIALTIASILYATHFACGVPLKHLAWGATAIGLVALLGMVQLWSRAARQQARLYARCTTTRRQLKTVEKRGGSSTPFDGPLSRC